MAGGYAARRVLAVVAALAVTLALTAVPMCAGARAVRTPVVVDLPADALTHTQNTENTEETGNATNSRSRRDLNVIVSQLNDLFPRAIIHYSGEGSTCVFVVTQGFSAGRVSASNVYRTRDYGQTWDVETGKFNGGVVNNYFPSPHTKDIIVFADIISSKLYITTDEGDSYTAYTVAFTPSEISYAHVPGLILARDASTGYVYVSRNNGVTWSSAIGDSQGNHAVLRYAWGTNGIGDDTDDTLYLEVQQATPGFSRLLRVRSLLQSDNPQVVEVSGAVNLVAGSFVIQDKYMFYQVGSGADRDLYVSYNRGNFLLASFDGPDATYDYAVLDAAEDQCFVAVKHGDSANLYISNREGVSFSLSLSNILSKSLSGSFQNAIIDFQRLDGLQGIYVASRQTPTRGIQSVITYDKGGEWNLLPPPAAQADDCEFPKCSLNFHMQYSASERGLGFEPLLSLASAPGIILGNGNLGATLTNRPSMFVSLDAGLSWQFALDDDQQYNIVDHGGVLVATDPYNARDKGTTSIRYSVDQGATWSEYNIATPLHFVAVLTEPDEKSTIISIWGYPVSAPYAWTTVRVDFASVLGGGRPCVMPDDYTQWSPRDERSPVGCLLGSRDVYTRRKAKSLCVNGYDFDRPVNSTACECVVDDYECDFGFEREDIDSVCLPVAAKDIVPSCKPGKQVVVSKNYRKISGDVCDGGIESLMQPFVYTCPEVCPMSEWSEWTTCDPCSAHKVQSRTRAPLDPLQDASICECTVEQRPCDEPSLAGAVQVAPLSGRAKLGEPVILTAILRNQRCGGVVSDSVYGDVSFTWTIPTTLKYALPDGVSLNAQVLDSIVFNTPGIYHLAVKATNGKDSETASNTMVVYDTDQWYLIDFTVSNGQKLSNSSLIKVRDLFPGIYSAASKFINMEQIVETHAQYTDNGKLFVRFQLLSLGGSENFFASVQKELTSLSSSTSLNINVDTNLVIQPIAGSAHQIDAPDGYVPLQPGTDGGNGKPSQAKGSGNATKVVVPIVICCLLLLVAGFLIYRRQIAHMRHRYERLQADDHHEPDVQMNQSPSPQMSRFVPTQMQEMGEFEEDDQMISP